MKEAVIRFLRAGAASLVAFAIPAIPGLGDMLPPPWNATVIPVLMSIAKFLRDSLNPANLPGHWTTKIPF